MRILLQDPPDRQPHVKKRKEKILCYVKHCAKVYDNFAFQSPTDGSANTSRQRSEIDAAVCRRQFRLFLPQTTLFLIRNRDSHKKAGLVTRFVDRKARAESDNQKRAGTISYLIFYGAGCLI